MNEPAFLAAGISHWQLQRFELYRVNPPLVRMIASLPVIATGAKTDWSYFHEHPGARPVFEIGNRFIATNAERSLRLFTMARWACIPFSLLGAITCYLWARDLYGTNSGLLAAVLWCFSPSILGHASLMTTDVPAAAMGLAACYAFWCWLKQPTWTMTVILGLLLGLAELTKLTLLVFYCLWPFLWLASQLTGHRPAEFRCWILQCSKLLLVFVVSLYTINLSYFFESSFTKLGDFPFVSRVLSGGNADIPGNRFKGTFIEALRIPLPKNYVLGLDVQAHDFEGRAVPSYLRGRFQDSGWWYYYLYALTVKIPLGTWGLFLMASALRCFRYLPQPPRIDELVLLAPAVTILTAASLQTGFSDHFRYVIPALPFVFIWISQVAQSFRSESIRSATIVGGLLLISIVSSLSVYPHSLSYFNQLGGGPRGGHRHLIGSNIDWGQDLLYLKEWHQLHEEYRPLFLEAVAMYNPADIGIICQQMPHNAAGELDLHPGWYAISVDRLHDENGKYDYFLKGRTPVAMAGYSIYIYHITLEDANRLREEVNLNLLSDDSQ